MARGAHRGSSAGFTLLEILLVLVVLAIASALTLPALIQPSGTQLRTAAGSLAAGLRQARNDAVSSHTDVRLTVFLNTREFLVGTGERRRSVPEAVSLSVFTARSEVLDDDSAAIRFFPDGSSTGGRVTLSAGDRRYFVDVDWMTGQVRVRAGSAADDKQDDERDGRGPAAGSVRLDS